MRRQHPFNPLIEAIAERGSRLSALHGQPTPFVTVALAVELTHESRPLDLAALLQADDGNFAHDVFGILKYLDWSTGRLREFFSPRFTRRPTLSERYRPMTEPEIEAAVSEVEISPKGWESV